MPSLQNDSVQLLRKLLTEAKQYLRSLASLGLPVYSWDIIIKYILSSKSD